MTNQEKLLWGKFDFFWNPRLLLELILWEIYENVGIVLNLEYCTNYCFILYA